MAVELNGFMLWNYHVIICLIITSKYYYFEKLKSTKVISFISFWLKARYKLQFYNGNDTTIKMSVKVINDVLSV